MAKKNETIPKREVVDLTNDGTSWANVLYAVDGADDYYTDGDDIRKAEDGSILRGVGVYRLEKTVDLKIR